MSPESLKSENFEIILTLEGIVPETGNGIQVLYFIFVQLIFEYKIFFPTANIFDVKTKNLPPF